MPKNLIVQINNPADKPATNTSLSDKRESFADKAKGKKQRQINNQQVQFHPYQKPIANLPLQSNQLQATTLCQSTSPIANQNFAQPTLHQQYYSNPYTHNSNPYVNNSQYPPTQVFPSPEVYNPLMPEQLPEPPGNMNFNETAPFQDRLGIRKTNPLIEHYK